MYGSAHTRPRFAVPARIAVVAVAALTAMFSNPRAAAAQASASRDGGSGDAAPAVTGTGRVTISRQPNVLRMVIELSGEGKDVKEALAALKAERATLAGKLKELGAAGEAVTFGEPRVGGAAGGAVSMQQRVMRQVARMRRAGNRAAAAAKAGADGAAAKVAVSLTAMAEWPLAGESAEELIVAGYTLRETLRAAGLSKPPPAARELTPEEQEEQEEMAGMMGEDGEEGAPAPGEPSFQFVARFTAAERDAAMAEAFKKAKAEAARVAAAAGGSLGGLRTVAGGASAAGDDDDDEYGFGRAMLSQLGMAGTLGGESADEATADEPGPVELRVTVTAGFVMK